MSMKKTLRVEGANPGRCLLAGLLDILSLVTASVALTFVVLYGFFNPIGGYQRNKAEATNIEDSYSLNLAYSDTYEQYETATKNFYLVSFPDEMVDFYAKTYGSRYSATHVYNILVLNLPVQPTAESYSTSLYAYVQNEDGSFNPDVLAVKVSGNEGRTYEKNMHDLFKTAYDELKKYLQTFDDHYASLIYQTYADECYSRAIAMVISIAIFYWVIPFTNKERSTLFEKILSIGLVNYRNGYIASTYKVWLRPVLYYLLPFIGCVFWNAYSVLTLCGLPLLVNLLLLIFRKENRDLTELILSLERISVPDSLLYKNDKEAKAAMEEMERTEKEDDFTKALENVDLTAEDEKDKK